jgi:hypothetical protein
MVAAAADIRPLSSKHQSREGSDMKDSCPVDPQGTTFMDCAETRTELRCSPRSPRRTSLGSAELRCPSSYSTLEARHMGMFMELRAEDGFLSRG